MPAEVKDLKPNNIIAVMASKYMLSPEKFITMVKKTCGLATATEEEFHLFLINAHNYDLNPLVRQIYAFQRPGGGLQFITGYDGWITIANRRPEYRGISHRPEWDVQGKEVVSITAIVKKQYPDGSTGNVEFTAYMREWKRNTDNWRTQPIHMLQVRATCQSIRLAFNLSGLMDEDEAERYFDQIRERQETDRKAGSTPLDTAGDIPGEPERNDQPPPGSDSEPGPQPEPVEPEVMPKEEFISGEQQEQLKDLITSYGWSYRVIPEVIQEYAGCPIDQILESQWKAVAAKIAKAGEAKKRAKK